MNKSLHKNLPLLPSNFDTGRGWGLTTTPAQPRLLHSRPSATPDVLPAAMETQHSRVRKKKKRFFYFPPRISATFDLHLHSSESTSPEEEARAAPLQAPMLRGPRSAPRPWWGSASARRSTCGGIKFTFPSGSLSMTYVCIYSPQKRRRWGALHVCIAWKIYHHKQLKVREKGPDRIKINEWKCIETWRV